MTDAAPAAHRPTVLVVDDTPQNLSLMSDLLEAEYSVKLAPSGARALKIIAGAAPDLILLDVMMPEMDGYEVCRTVKADPGTRDIPVIFLTAMDRMEDEEKGLKLGAMDYITKPISPAILLARVRNQLALKEASDRLRAQNQQLEEEKARTRDLLRKVKEAADKMLEHNRQLKQAQGNAGEVLRRLGRDYFRRGQLDTAWELLRECPLDDALAEELNALARAFEGRQQIEQAAAVFRHMTGAKAESPALGAAHAAEAAPSSGQAAPAAMPASLGRYRIHKALGRGAMGVVYLGADPVIGRIVAIKTTALAEGFAGEDPAAARERFFREAKSAGSLAHPNIVAIYDVGEEHGLGYIAMEFLKGADLSARARPEALLPLAKVLAIVEHVAEALGYAHARGIVHRDIKPSNIVYEAESDSVKVTDFGIASIGIAGIGGSARADGGALLGTPSYMSPEQTAGAPLDGRSDLYSLGVTLYALACGHLPFKAETLDDLMRRIAGEPPTDIRFYNDQLPDCVAAIVNKALAKDPGQRFQAGEQMVEALRLCRRSMSVFAA